MDALQEAVARGKKIMLERNRQVVEAEEARSQHIEMVKAAIHAKALELVPEAFRQFTQPVGLRWYKHYWMDYSDTHYYWAEQIQVTPVTPPVVMRFEVKKLGYTGNTTDERLCNTVIEEISLEPYTHHDRTFLAIAQAHVDEECESGWYWNYHDAIQVGDSLDVALAMADEMKLDPPFFGTIKAKKNAQEKDVQEESASIIKEPEYYSRVEKWFNARVVSTNSERDELLGQIGLVLTDIAMSLKMLSISAMEQQGDE